MDKQKCKFTNEIKSKYLCFQNGHDEWTPVWYVNQQLTCLWWTKVLLIFEPAWWARKHKKAVGGETFQQKQRMFFTILGRKSDDAVLAALGAFPFQTMKHLFYSQQYFMILK